jgi:hypothetical protein
VSLRAFRAPLKGDVSVVSNGLLKGKSVMDIINEVPSELLEVHSL